MKMHHHLSKLPVFVGIIVMTAAAGAGQNNVTKPGETVERHLSDDQKFREWSHESDSTDNTKRVKVCREETVCKMRFKEGQTPRTRVKNLVAPFRYEDETTPIGDTFIKQVRQALDNMQSKRGVTVRFIGYTDDAPLTGRDEQNYGDAPAGSDHPRYVGHTPTGNTVLRMPSGEMVILTPRVNGPPAHRRHAPAESQPEEEPPTVEDGGD